MTALVATHEDRKNPYAISNGDGETTPLLQDGREPLIRAYWWRWVVLAVFVLNLAVNNAIWITFGPIADVIGCYYNISDFWVNSLSMIYMVVYVVLVLPSSWMLSRMGLRTTVILSSFTTALGACLRLTGCAFPEVPPTPPSISRKLESHSITSFWSSLLKVVKNGYFLLFMFTYGINIAVQGSLFTVANEVVHPNFQNSDKEIAYMGLVAEAVSIVAMLVIARLLDWTKAFYVLSVVLYVTAAVSVAGFSAAVLYQKNFIVVCATFTFTSATTTSFMAVAYEYAVEMTYPLPEGTSAGLVNASSQILSIVFIVVVGNFATKNVSIGVWFITGVTAIGALLTLFIRPELRRVKLDNPKSLGIQEESPS